MFYLLTLVCMYHRFSGKDDEQETEQRRPQSLFVSVRRNKPQTAAQSAVHRVG